MKRIAYWTLPILILFFNHFAFAQDDPHAACATPPSYVPSDLLQRPVELHDGIGNSQENFTTKSHEAEAFYNQGLNQKNRKYEWFTKIVRASVFLLGFKFEIA